jgi:hypothetical protein
LGRHVTVGVGSGRLALPRSGQRETELEQRRQLVILVQKRNDEVIVVKIAIRQNLAAKFGKRNLENKRVWH